ncbi:MAG TPA: type II CAAX endopeptidase family protein [Vicinamibacteria bacterium]|jgi:membrane protease YdiL (CAAX protease family)|nr:type II CAAX endopeptidase family protein [Vicinamibacteria bacterium]
MGAPRSDRSPDALPGLWALAVAVAGTVAMWKGMVYGRGLGLDLRQTLLVGELLLVGPGLLALALARLPLVASLHLNPGGRRTTLLAVAGGGVFWGTSYGLLELQNAFWPPAPGYLEGFRRLLEALRPTGPLDWAFSLAAIAVAPAVAEEVLSRGIVLPSLRGPLGDGGAVAASAVVFGLMHLDPYRLPFTVMMGLALGTLRVRTGSLVPGILAHATLNALTFTAAPFLDDAAQAVPDPRPLLGAAVLLVGGALSVLLITRFPLTPTQPPPKLSP